MIAQHTSKLQTIFEQKLNKSIMWEKIVQYMRFILYNLKRDKR